MITVGVKELKNKLSHYLRDVKRGKPVTITKRGQSVAMLIPADDHPDARSVREMIWKGIGSWRGGKPKGASRLVVIKGKPISQIILEDRR
jgi:prevent-host-death family protein